jgi:hypothetical protein
VAGGKSAATNAKAIMPCETKRRLNIRKFYIEHCRAGLFGAPRRFGVWLGGLDLRALLAEV